ncbi:MAG TPA: glycosyltransferase family 4 protein [Chloroflexi bacterium]|nr:glycosyltransferase family 4 protein [Chloroflexota bacterium]
MRIALVHDWLNQHGGAEKVLEAMVGLYPDAPVYTSMYAPDRMPEAYRAWDIRTTWMDRLPGIHAHHQPYLPLYPLAFDRLDLSDYDVVLSNKSGFCHGVRTDGALHICYCLTPTRYLWQFDAYIERERLSPALAAALRPLVGVLKRWDYAAAQRVDHFIAISSEIQRRIARYYRRDSVILYPPVETSRYAPADRHDDYYLVVSRLIPYKRVDLAVRACTRLGLPLLVAGSGRDRERLEEMAGPTVQFLGRVPDEDLPDLLARCRAFLFPGLEDFGIAPVEAQAAGRPVIAYRGGGALDTVIEGETGLFFDEQSVESLCDALERFEGMTFSPAACRASAERFDAAVFDRELAAFVRTRYDDRRRGRPAGDAESGR